MVQLDARSDLPVVTSALARAGVTATTVSHCDCASSRKTMNAYSTLRAARAAVAPHSDRPASAILLDTPDVRLLVFRIPPGTAIPAHRNRSYVTITVLEGHGTLSGEQHGSPVDRYCTTGDVVVYTPNELHSMCAAETELLLLVTITPAQEQHAAIA